MKGDKVARRPDVTWQGMTETQALEGLLGSDGLTEDHVADLLRAVAAIQTRRDVTEAQYKIILHALHVELGTWDAVAQALGKVKSTVWRWAHPEGTPMRPGTA
jgi:hypothetical protein